jgi:hypothetical protein
MMDTIYEIGLYTGYKTQALYLLTLAISENIAAIQNHVNLKAAYLLK